MITSKGTCTEFPTFDVVIWKCEDGTSSITIRPRNREVLRLDTDDECATLLTALEDAMADAWQLPVIGVTTCDKCGLKWEYTEETCRHGPTCVECRHQNRMRPNAN